MKNKLKRQLNAQQKRKESSFSDSTQLFSHAEKIIDSNPIEAANIYTRLVEEFAQHPSVFLAYFRLGQIARRSGQLVQATEFLTRSLYFNIDFYLSYIDLGYCYLSLGDQEAAYNFYKHAISLSEKDNAHLGYLGALNCCSLGNLYEQGILLAKEALVLDPHNEIYLDRLSYFLHSIGQWEQAYETILKALKINPSNPQIYFNLAEIYRYMGLHQQSCDSYRKALSLQPHAADFHVNLSHQLLLMGNYKEGWKEHEWRRQKKGLFRVFKSPHWNGEISLDGKTLLLYAEQGFGDTIQFCRYISLLKTTHKVKIIFQCHPELVTLLAQLKDIDYIFSYIDDPEQHQFDYHCSIMSLPYYLGTNSFDLIPFKDSAYLQPLTKENLFWQTLLSNLNETNLKIGLVWQGALPKKEDNEVTAVPDLRNASLLDFAPLLDIPNCTFYSLQKGSSSLDIPKYGLQSKIIDFTNKMGDFADTAAFISQLDLVIGVDTAVLHLASSIGTPAWLLSRHTGCWRWLTEEQVGNSSPWYPKLKLYRQKTRNSWKSEIEQVYKDLQLLSENKCQPII